MTQKEKLEALAKWEEHCKHVHSLTSLEHLQPETEQEKKTRIRRLQNNYQDFCEYYFAHWMTLRDKVTGEIERTIHNAFFHNAAARLVKDTPNLKAVFEWPRGHAKSTHCDVFIPLWLMFQPQRLINVMVVVGKSEDSAQGLLSDLQAELENNQRIIADFGEQKSIGVWTDGEFVTSGGVAFFARGRGQSPRGLRYKENRPDYIVIDDLDDDELCRNEARVKALTDWVKEALFGALDAGRGRFIMVGNLISKNSVLQNIIDTPGVKVSRVNAVDKDGNPVWTEKWTKEEAKAAAEFMGYRAWQKEMMHNPINDGTIFRYEWIKYRKPLRLSEYTQLICYTDPSFKSSNNDYKATVLIGKRKDHTIDIIDCMVRQCSVRDMVRWQYDLYERHCIDADNPVVITFMMEANFMQDILLDEFSIEGNDRGYQLPLTPDKRKKPDKIARIEAVSPLWERGFVFYNEKKAEEPDFKTLIDQTTCLERGSRVHDDGPDACEGAIWYLQRSDRSQGFAPIIGHRTQRKNQW